VLVCERSLRPKNPHSAKVRYNCLTSGKGLWAKLIDDRCELQQLLMPSFSLVCFVWSVALALSLFALFQTGGRKKQRTTTIPGPAALECSPSADSGNWNRADRQATGVQSPELQAFECAEGALVVIGLSWSWPRVLSV